MVQSGNYVPNMTGMKIDLGNGVLIQSIVNLIPEGKVTMTGGSINITTDDQEKSLLRFMAQCKCH